MSLVQKVPLSFDLGWEYIVLSQYEARIVMLERSLFSLYYSRTYGGPSTYMGVSYHQSENCGSFRARTTQDIPLSPAASFAKLLPRYKH